MLHKGKNITPLRIVVNLSKVVLLILAIRYIYRQIFIKQDLDLLFDQLAAAVSEPHFYLLFIPVILLMPLNWLVETLKWQLLTGKFEKVIFYNCLKAVLTGLSLGIMTPARVGEFAGRIMYLEPENRIKGVMASFLGSISQLAATLSFGLISAWIILPHSFPDTEILSYLAAINLIVIPGVLFIYFFINKTNNATSESQGSFQKWMNASALYSRKERFRILLLSMIRYMIFTTQFVLLIVAFGGNVDFIYAFGHAAITFLGMTLIPTFALAEAGIRGSIAIEVFGLMEINPLGILSASVLLWTINLMIPTLLGIYFMLRFKLKKSE